MFVRYVLSAALLGLLMTGVSCGDDVPEGAKPIVTVNDYVITDKEFRRRILTTAKLYEEGPLSQEDKKRYLEREIQKELLIQKAVEMGLEREEAFRDAIQRFWEQTLIKSLMEKESERLSDSDIVTVEELNEAYEEMKKANPEAPPLAEAKEELIAQIREEKKLNALLSWIKELRKKADIRINEENLKAFR